MFDCFSTLCMKGSNSDCRNILKLYKFYSKWLPFEVFADSLRVIPNLQLQPRLFFLKVNHQKKLLLYCNLQKKGSVSACGLKQKIYPKKVEKQNLQHKTLRFLTFPKVLEALKS